MLSSTLMSRLAELSSLGLKKTHQRALILEILETGGQHLTAEEIGQAVLERGVQLNRSTVYRTLETLSDVGILKSSRAGRATRYEVAHPGSDHHHLVCDVCGGTSHLPGGDADEIINRQSVAMGFSPGTVEILVRGRCRECRGSRKPTPLRTQ